VSKYAVEFSRRASAQIRSIFSYIAEDNADAALKMVDKLEAKAAQLKDNPFIGTELSEDDYPFLPSGYRRLVVKPFVMYYRAVNKIVYITNIVHSKREQAKAFVGEHSRRL